MSRPPRSKCCHKKGTLSHADIWADKLLACQMLAYFPNSTPLAATGNYRSLTIAHTWPHSIHNLAATATRWCHSASPLRAKYGSEQWSTNLASWRELRLLHGRHMAKGSISKLWLFVRISALGKLRALFPLVASACLNNASFPRYLWPFCHFFVTFLWQNGLSWDREKR